LTKNAAFLKSTENVANDEKARLPCFSSVPTRNFIGWLLKFDASQLSQSEDLWNGQYSVTESYLCMIFIVLLTVIEVKMN
jgi:hypothetical protein